MTSTALTRILRNSPAIVIPYSDGSVLQRFGATDGYNVWKVASPAEDAEHTLTITTSRTSPIHHQGARGLGTPVRRPRYGARV
jgi:hypothetical protein